MCCPEPQAQGGAGGGGPLFRGGLAGLLPKACGSLPPAPPAPPGRAELEKKAGEEGGGAGATGQRQTGSEHAVTSGARARARAGRAEGQPTRQRTRPQRAAPGALKPPVCARATGARGQTERGRRAAEEGCTEEAAGSEWGRDHLPEQSSRDAHRGRRRREAARSTGCAHRSDLAGWGRPHGQERRGREQLGLGGQGLNKLAQTCCSPRSLLSRCSQDLTR